ncbi:hypothetical protein Cni_G04939 [Canna indica]|uniref:Uncharacterized protein n=1 Tax=Canna indica TaxID=4628 RepID=A0AAQ3Q4Y8_9LILI|nr:hypothetical protein Cni_G04939 [Canna indica]
MENDDNHLIESKVDNPLFSYNDQPDLDNPPLVNVPIKIVASLTRGSLYNQNLGNDINLPGAKKEDKNKDKVDSIAPSFASFVKHVSSTLGNARKVELTLWFLSIVVLTNLNLKLGKVNSPKSKYQKTLLNLTILCIPKRKIKSKRIISTLKMSLIALLVPFVSSSLLLP